MPSASDEFSWWREGVIYQIYPRSFADSNGDGVGDLDGITAHIDYIASLGVSAVWLSPIYKSPMADFGYDVADYCDIDDLFGGMEAFDRFIEAAHDRGLKVVMDYVPNHSSDQHEWFIESRASRDNPKRDWYVWKDPKPDGSPPNNWKAAFGGDAWTLDEETGQYYLHLFLPEQPDLNWRNPEVREAMNDVLRFWMRKGVDGFRIDVVTSMIKVPTFEDNPPGNLMAHVAPNDEVHEIVRGFRKTIDEFEEKMLVGETFVMDVAEVVSYYGNGNDELNLAFNFPFALSGFNGRYLSKVFNKTLDLMPTGAQPCLVLSNHDLPRHAFRFGREVIGASALMILGLPGTPFLYAGEELGMTGSLPPPEQQVDPGGRDAARTPFQWDATETAGFTDAGVEPWLPLAKRHEVENVAVEEADSDSVLALYRRAIAYRNDSDALRRGDFQEVAVAEKLWAWTRSYEGASALVCINMGDSPSTVVFPGDPGATGRIDLATARIREGETLSGSVEIEPYGAVVISLNPGG